MRRLRYSVASSLDGFIAGPNGEFDWIPMDPDIDFGAMFSRYDTLLMGRATYEASSSYPGGMSMWKHMRSIVCSTTLTSVEGAELWSENVPERIRALKSETGKDLWLFGGGDLFRTLLDAGFHHLYEYGTIPIFLVLGGLHRAPVVLEDGSVTSREVFKLRYTYDERIDDGLNARFGIDTAKRVLEHPFEELGCVADDKKDAVPLGRKPETLAASAPPA